jgi:hypothetical protein
VLVGAGDKKLHGAAPCQRDFNHDGGLAHFQRLTAKYTISPSKKKLISLK